MATEVQERRKKLEWFKQQGIRPYAYNFDQKHHAGTILNNYNRYEGENVKVAGRLTAVRGHGKLGFGDVRDGSGTIQMMIRVDQVSKQDFQIWQHLDRGDIIGIEGRVDKTRRGEVTIIVKTIKLLAKCLNALPDSHVGVTDPEIKYRNRVLDLVTNEESRKVFRMRPKIISAIREFLEARGFVDVETPLLQQVYGGANARPFTTHCDALDSDLYLSIAPELYLKRYNIGGFERVYEITKKFRNEGIDKQHNPEHMTVEWYQCYADYNDGMDLVEEFFKFLTKKLFGRTTITYQGHKIDFGKKWRRMSLLDAVKKYTGVDVSEVKTDAEARKIAEEQGIEPEGLTKNNLADELIKTFRDKLIQPTFLTDYPIEICPLAKPKRGHPKFAEIFQPFAGGIELARAYSELNNPEKQAEHFAEQEKERERGNVEAHPTDKNYVRALRYGLPPACGVGFGIERIVMLFTDQKTIRDVIAFPLMRKKD